MKNLLPIIVLTLGPLLLMGQPSNKISTEKYIETAEKAFQNNNFNEALKIYYSVYDKTNDSQIIPMLVQNLHATRNYKEVIKWADVYFSESEKDSDIIKLYQALSLNSCGQYSKSIELIDEIKDSKKLSKRELILLDQAKKGAEFALRSSEAEDVTVSNVGSPINNKASEYSPFLLPNKNLYYTALSNTGVIYSESPSVTAKIWTVTENEGKYNQPTELNAEINDPDYFQSNVTLSNDGKRMIFARQIVTSEGNIQTSHLYSSEFINDEWSKPISLHNLDSDIVYKSPCFGVYQGEEGVFFVTKTKKGDYDILFSPFNGKGKMDTPINIGHPINSIFDEESPYFHDGILYFSSKGHIGFGGYDIFKADLSSYGNIEILNLGQPYNSPADDLYFMKYSDFEGVFVSNREWGQTSNSLSFPTCCNDIYSFSKLNLEIEPVVFDKNTNEKLKDYTVVLKTQSGEIVSNFGSKNSAQVTPKGSYVIEVKHEGYDLYEERFEIDQNISQVIKKEVFLIPTAPIIEVVKEETKEVVTVAEPIVLEEILFEYNDDKITSASENDLNYLLNLMTQYPDMKIRISSHTDSRGGEDYNLKLSHRRSLSVMNWLVNNGIDNDRIESIGVGSGRPLKIYDSLASKYSFLRIGNVLDDSFIQSLLESQKEIAHQLNRRSEFEIIEGPKVILRRK